MLFFVLEGGGWVAGANNARLYFEDDPDNRRIGAWCASSRNPQWIKVDLGKVKQITGIATQGNTLHLCQTFIIAYIIVTPHYTNSNLIQEWAVLSKFVICPLQSGL